MINWNHLDLMKPQLVGASKQLYHMLVLLLEGKAFVLQRPIPKGEGLVVWRKQEGFRARSASLSSRPDAEAGRAGGTVEVRHY